jgi:hypothetical protein
MLPTSGFALPLRRQAVILSTFAMVLVFASGAAAAIIDFNTLAGTYNTSGNWINYTTNDTTVVPTVADEAVARNGGTLTISAANGDAMASIIRIGAGPLTGDPVAPVPPTGPGTLNFTGGNILGDGTNGARLDVGQRDNATNTNYTGIVNHSGGKISLNLGPSRLVIGATGSTMTPTSVYNLMPGGTIGVVVGSGNTNNGINVRNGTFNMTGGSIVTDGAASGQRAMTISSTSGTLGNENVAYANFSGGVVDVRGGLRMASSSHSQAYATISGAADLKFTFNDVQLGANATNAFARVDMSGGSLRVGDVSIGDQRRLIVGDAGEGRFNLSGGTVTINHSFVVANNTTSKGVFNQTGGTFTVRDIEMNRNSGTYPATETAAIIIDGPTAVFNQQNNAGGSGFTTIGQFGTGRFEVRLGQANLREIRASQNPGSRATLNVAGGILRVQDGLSRTNVDAATIPTINLTGGELELTPAGAIVAWQAGMVLNGTDFDSKPGAILQTNIGNSTRPGDFAVNTGSIWHLDIASNTLVGGADWVDVNNGTAALNGGLLNISHIGGYTPVVGDTVRILRNLLAGTTLGGVTVSNPNWVPILAAGNTEIHLTYVPEPSSMLLFGIGLVVFSAARRSASRR